MRGALLYGPRDIRFEDRETPKLEERTHAARGQPPHLVYDEREEVVGSPRVPGRVVVQASGDVCQVLACNDRRRRRHARPAATSIGYVLRLQPMP